MQHSYLRTFATGSLALAFALGLTAACGDDEQNIDPGGGGQGGETSSGGAPGGGAPGTGGRADAGAPGVGGEGGAPGACTADCSIFETDDVGFFSYDEVADTTHFNLRLKSGAPALVSARVRLTAIECSSLQYGSRSVESFELTLQEDGVWSADLTDFAEGYGSLIVEDFTVEAVTCDGESLVVAQAVNTENWNRPRGCEGVGIGTFEGFAWCPGAVVATPPTGEGPEDTECAAGEYVCQMTNSFSLDYFRDDENHGSFTVYMNADSDYGTLTDATLALYQCECGQDNTCAPGSYSIEYVAGRIEDNDGFRLTFDYDEPLANTYRAVLHLANECEEQTLYFWNQDMVCGTEPHRSERGLCLTEGPREEFDLE